MDKLKQKLHEIRQTKRLGLMTHVVVGYPTLADTVELVKIMAKEGVDIVELQIPFSDPLADGPTIMKACEQSLENGTKVKDAFLVMKQLAKEVTTPLLFMAYYNTVFRYSSSERRKSRRDAGQASMTSSRPFGLAQGGHARTIKSSVEQFCLDAKVAGASGLIVPDVPIEEEATEHFISLCKKYGLANIRVVSPASTVERLQKNANVGTGFVYCTARQGITGARKELNEDLVRYLKTVRKHFSIPIAVGFGISRREHVAALQGHADIAIVGSALIEEIGKGNKGGMADRVASFIRSLNVID